MHSKNFHSRAASAMYDGISGDLQHKYIQFSYGNPASRAAKRIVDGNIRPFYSSLFLDPEEAQRLQHLAEQRKESRLALLTRQEETKRRIRNQSLVARDWTRTASSTSKQGTDEWSKYRLSIERQSRGSQGAEASSRMSSVIPALSKPGSQTAQSQELKRRRELSLIDADATMHERLAVRHPPFLLIESQIATDNGPTRGVDQLCCVRLSDIGKRYANKRLEGLSSQCLTVDAEQILSNMQRHDDRFNERSVSFNRPNFTVDMEL